MLREILASPPATPLGWLLSFAVWFALWAPAVALLEYATHRWIMHWANRLLDPRLVHLKAHGRHHQGDNGHEFVDIPLKDCLLLTSPFFLLLAAWGLAVGPWSALAAPAAALAAWSCVYTYLWARVHRAIHGVEANWFGRCGRVFRFFRDHHLRHHADARVNYATMFPWTDYLFGTWRGRAGARSRRRESDPAKAGE